MTQLGIIAALPAEAKCLTGKSGKKHKAFTSPQKISENVLLLISGVGPEQATAAAATLVRHGADALLSWGCAGALSADLQPGNLLLPRSIKPETAGPLYTDEKWHVRLTDHIASQLSETCKPWTGTLAGSADILKGPEQKKALHASSGAFAVDMESAAIAVVAQRSHIPFMAIRAIADDVETTIPSCISDAMDIYGNISPGRLLPSIVRRPGTCFQLLRLGRHFGAAKATLSQIAKMAGPAFLAP